MSPSQASGYSRASGAGAASALEVVLMRGHQEFFSPSKTTPKDMAPALCSSSDPLMLHLAFDILAGASSQITEDHRTGELAHGCFPGELIDRDISSKRRWITSLQLSSLRWASTRLCTRSSSKAPASSQRGTFRLPASRDGAKMQPICERVSSLVFAIEYISSRRRTAMVMRLTMLGTMIQRGR